MIVDDAAVSTIKAKIDSTYGPAPDGVDASVIDQGRQKLATAIAAAAGYVRDNAVVEPGIPVATNTGSGQTTGPGTLS